MTKAAFMSLNMKHINVCSVKTKVIVIPGLPDSGRDFSKSREEHKMK